MKQVIIIGAGPSGSTCGYLLKKAGVDCIIIDYATFPREKICGGGLTPKAIINDVDFSIINRELFRKKKRKEVLLSNFCYSRFGLWLMKLGSHHPNWIKKAFEMNY